jgi:hypothetical protein
MGKAILMDKILKLIVEDVNVTRIEQISKLLKVDYDTVLSLLKEMEKSSHISLLTVSGGAYVIVLKSPGRQFYKSSRSYAELTTEGKRPAKSFKQMILDLFKRRNQD